MHVFAICAYDVNIAILIIQNGAEMQTYDKKRSLCTDAPLPFLYTGYKKNAYWKEGSWVPQDTQVPQGFSRWRVALS